MRQILVRLLNLRHSETKIVSRLMAVQFIMGLGTAFLLSSSYSLFLFKFPIKDLPFVFIATAFLLFPVNWMYSWIDSKLNSHRLFEVMLLISGSVVIAGLLTWFFLQSFFAALILLAINLTVYMLLSYAYWGMASLLFDVREGRRVFSVIGAGDIPAKMIGYLLVPFISQVAGPEGAIVMAVLLFFTAYFVGRRLLRSVGINWDEFEHHQQHPLWKVPIRDWWARIFGDKLIFRIAVLSFFAYLFYFTVDFCFLSEIKVRNKSVQEVTTFISIFFFVGRALALFTKLIFSSRFLLKLGITRTLFITPVLLLTLTLLLLVVGVEYQNPSFYIFGFGVLTLFSEVLRSSIQEPVFFVLFQPLAVHLRLKGHLIAKGFILPPALLLVGGGLLYYLSQTGGHVNLALFLPCLLAVLLCWIGMIPLLKQAYRKTVTEVMGRSFFSGAALFLDDKKITESLLKKVETGKPVQIIHSLDLLERSGYQGFVYLLKAQLDHPDAEVVLYVVERLVATGKNEQVIRALKGLIDQKELDLKVRNRAIGALCLLDHSFGSGYTENITQADTYIRLALLKGLLKREENTALQDMLVELAGSNERLARLDVATFIGTERLDQFPSILEKLIGDEDEAVRNASIESAGNIGMASLIPSMIEWLNDPQRTHAATKALISMGDTVFLRPGFASQSYSDIQQRKLANIAASTSGAYGQAWLLAKVSFGGISDNGYLVDAIWRRGNKLPDAHKHRMEILLAEGLQICQMKQAMAEPFTADNNWLPLARAIRFEVKEQLNELVKICGLLYEPSQFSRVLQVLQTNPSKEKVTAALEIIEMNVAGRYAQRLGALLEWSVLGGQKVVSSFKLENQLVQLVHQIHEKGEQFNKWTIGLMYYLAGKSENQLFGQLATSKVPVASQDVFVLENYHYLKAKFEK